MVLIGSTIAFLPALPAKSTDIAIALLLGWSLGITVSPYAVGALLIAQSSGRSPRELWMWNLRFSPIACVLVVVLLFFLAHPPQF